MIVPVVDIVAGDCRTGLRERGPYGMLIADPPYGETSLEWDRRGTGWHITAANALSPQSSLWVFGSLRFFMAEAAAFDAAGLRIAQEIVWEKHNGSGFHADRFKRVHELAAQFYLKDAPWEGVWNDVQRTADATARTIRRKRRPVHLGDIGGHHYESEDGGPRIMRSVIYARSCHGRAIHPTEKPVDLLEVLIRTSCPPGGLVGDLFAGSGAAGEAARNAGRSYVGFEIDPRMADLARDRLAAKLPLVSG